MCCFLAEKFYHVTSHKYRLLLATLSAAFGSGFLIYSTYVTNNVQIVGELWLNDSYRNIHGSYPSKHTLNLYWAAVIAAKEVGKIFGTFMLPLIAENLGRKSGLLLNAVVTVVGCFLCLIGLDRPYYVVMIGRVLLGITMICGAGLASLFLIEVAPMEFRGASGSFIQIFRGFGGLMGMVLTLPEILGTPVLWTLALAVPAIPALFQFTVLMFCLESPRHLFITEDKIPEATRSIKFYQGEENVSNVIDDLRSEKKHIESQNNIPIKTLVQSGDFWRPFLLASLALTNRSLAGILIIQSYSTDIFISAGFGQHFASYSTVLLGVCHLVSALFGRRRLLIGSNFGCLICLMFVGVTTLYSDLHPWVAYCTVAGLVVFMLIYPVVASVRDHPNIVASEICHQQVRSVAFTVGYLCYSVVGLASTFIYPILKEEYGVAGSFVPFCVFLVLATVVYWVWLPETGGKRFEKIAFHSATPSASDLEQLEEEEQDDIVKDK